MKKALVTLVSIFFVLSVLPTDQAAGTTNTTIDFPNAFMTSAQSSNGSGEVVGYYLTATFETHGFIWIAGNFVTVDFPGSGFTQLNGINDAGTIVGIYTDLTGLAHGFSYNGGAFTAIDYPGSFYTWATAINNAGTIVGFYGISGQGGGNFGYSLSNGAFTSFSYPGAAGWTHAYGINDTGDIVGSYRLSTADTDHGFSLINSIYSSIDYPGTGVTATFAYGINNSETIVGVFGTNQSFTLSNGTYTPFVYPGSVFNFTNVNGINNVGMLVGYYYGADSHNHGFLATPALQTGPVRNFRTHVYYLTPQDAYNSAQFADTIQATVNTFSSDFNLNLAIPVLLIGGYDTTFTSIIGFSTLAGTLTVSNSGMIIENFIIK